jgi:hypothetical protein
MGITTRHGVNLVKQDRRCALFPADFAEEIGRRDVDRLDGVRDEQLRRLQRPCLARARFR